MKSGTDARGEQNQKRLGITNLRKWCLPIADSLNKNAAEDLPKQVEMLREFGIWPVLINLARVDEFCPVIVEMCDLRTDYYSNTKNYKLHCLKVKQTTHPF